MPTLDAGIQKALWRLADALAKSLRTPSGDSPGDPQWRVVAMASRAWKIAHPDLPLVKDDKGASKDVLLQLHVQHESNSDQWFVVAQNKVVGPDSHASPRALIVAKEEAPPSENWPFEEIAEAAANFFKQQKQDLVQKAQALAPTEQPGSVDPTPPQSEEMPPGGAGLAPMAARRRKLAATLLRTADRVLVLPSSAERDLGRLVLSLNDKGMKEQARLVATELLGNKNTVAESSCQIRRNRVGSVKSTRSQLLASKMLNLE